MVFLVLSFDWGGSDFVKLHACTEDFDSASQTYDRVHGEVHDYNLRQTPGGLQVLVELLSVPNGFTGNATLFFPTDTTEETEAQCSHIYSNNGEYTRS